MAPHTFRAGDLILAPNCWQGWWVLYRLQQTSYSGYWALAVVAASYDASADEATVNRADLETMLEGRYCFRVSPHFALHVHA